MEKTVPRIAALVLTWGFLLAQTCATAAQKKAGPEVSAPFSAKVAPATDPAYAAFDEGLYMKALKLAEEAAARGEPEAHTLIGQIFENGLGVAKDEIKAAEWYAKGAALGDMHAQFRLGVMLIEGRGVKQDRQKAASFFELAAAQNHALAQYNLALLYIEGFARPQDFAKAAQLLELSARQDHPQAQYDLGALYAKGEGVPKNLAKAAEWTGLAARAGLTDAQLDYAIMLINGTGVAKNETQGVALLRAAAEKNNPVAQNRLARAYAFGVGVEIDPVEAAKWHLLARAAGVSDGRLDVFLAGLPPQTRSAAEKAAADWRERTDLF
jgi:TPR repeat protein